MDPDHSSAAIDTQIAGGAISGFVASAAATVAGRGVAGSDPACVMGYYDGSDVPVHDHLAEQFAVCNRLYALCGVAAGSRDDRPLHVPPLYRQPSFVRHLDAAGCPGAEYALGLVASGLPFNRSVLTMIRHTWKEGRT
jgi:phospholipase C